MSQKDSESDLRRSYKEEAAKTAEQTAEAQESLHYKARVLLKGLP
jgi:hypothetical protein